MAGKKVLYCASTTGHLISFHIPYMKMLQAQGWEVHGGGNLVSPELDFLDEWVDMPFEKSITSPKNFAVAGTLAKRLNKERYDLILVHTSLAAFFVRLAVKLGGKGKTVVVNTVHGYLFDDDTPLLRRTMLLQAEKFTASVTDRLITMNACDTAIATKYRLCRGDVVEIPGMGVDFSRFAPPSEAERVAARASFGILPDDFVIVYGAEFSVRKNQALLISLLPKLPENVVLLLPGRGAELESCKAAAASFGRRVIFPGFVSNMTACYHGADLCVSASRSEGLPFNIMEAMSSGLPVLATAVKGHTDLITSGKNGVLFPRDDGDAFIAAASELMSDRQTMASLGDAGRQSVQKYSLENVKAKAAEAMFGWLH